MDAFTQIFINALQQTGLSLLHNWPYLLVGIIVSTLLRLYVNAEKISSFLRRFSGWGVVAATAAAVGTPLCSCGTTAVILGMMASTMPWAPIVAFMVASPLTSPEELFYSAGLFGWPFALAFFAASILLGLAGGAIAALLDSRGWLANQTRFQASTVTPQPVKTGVSAPCACSSQPVQVAAPTAACACNSQPVELLAPFQPSRLQPACACEAPAAALSSASAVSQPLSPAAPAARRTGFKDFIRELAASLKQFLPMFLGFAFIGYLLNGLIPPGWVSAIFGSGNIYSVPLAATLGLPLYINTEGSLPLVRALIENGMSQGAALAFLIAGSGTSFGAIAGLLTIARWRVVALVVGVLWAGAILCGYAYDVMLMLRLF